MASERWYRRPLAAVMMLTLTLTPVAAAAEPSAADKETARNLLDDGDRKMGAGNVREALAAYKAADDIMGVPTTGIEVARAQIKLGLLVEGRDTLQRVSRIPQRPGEPTAFARARAEASQLDEQLQKRIPSVRVLVTGLTAGAAAVVTIDGETVQPTLLGLPRRVNPGTRRIVASARDHESVSTDVTLAEGQSQDVSLQLRPLPAGATPAAAPPASGAAAPAPTTSAPTAATFTPVTVDTSSGLRRPALVYGGFGLAALGLTVGGVSGLVALVKSSSLKSDCPDNRCQESSRGDIVATKNWAAVSNIGLAVGVVGAGIGLVALIASKGGSSSARRPAIEPTVGLGQAGLRGQF